MESLEPRGERASRRESIPLFPRAAGPEDAATLAATETELRRIIESYRPGLGGRVRIHFTNNSCTMVSKYERRGETHLRVHHLFCHAPPALLRDLVRFCFLRVRRETSRRIRSDLMDFVERHRDKTLVIYPPSRRLPPRGIHYDLTEVLAAVRDRHVAELETTPEVAWTRQAHRTMMGKWVPSPSPHPNIILINRLLDDADVPRFYVEFVVFHELLHELMPVGRACGRWVHHPPEFRRRERAFPDFERSVAWEMEHLPRLYARYRRRRSGRSA